MYETATKTITVPESFRPGIKKIVEESFHEAAKIEILQNVPQAEFRNAIYANKTIFYDWALQEPMPAFDVLSDAGKVRKKILYNTYKYNYTYTYKRFVMEAKLTLKMDQKIINSIKQYAAKNDKSISKMVEDYFRNLTVAHKEPENISPLVKELSGIIDEKDLEKVSYTDYLEKKYE